MRGRAGTAVVLVAVAAAAPAGAAEYFVDAEAPAAADTNPGTAESPWLTIGHAADTAVAGDTVTVRPGTYPERVVLTTPGADGARIVFRALPSRAAAMHGFKVDGADRVTIDGFAITNSDEFDGWDETQGVFVGADDVEVLNCSFHDMHDSAVVGYWHDPFPQRARIAGNSAYRMQAGIMITGADWVVEHNEVNRLYQYGEGDCDYSRFFGDRHLIHGNWFHGTDFDEIGDAHVDCFQTFDNNGETGHDIVVDGNYCTDFHQAFMGEASFHHDISRITFSNNVFAHGLAWGLCIGDLAEVFAYNNTFAHIAYHGIGARGAGSTGHIVQNNIFYDVETSYWVDEGATMTGDYNLIFEAGEPGTPGAHDLIGVDPLFLDDDGDDYHLRAGSPAIDAGMLHADIATDRDGTARPQGAGWDIGAYEFAAVAPLAITNLGLPAATAGVGYGAQLRATGGTRPYRWSMAAGSLPRGLGLNADDGWLTGRPESPGAYAFTAQVTDAASATAARELTIVVTGTASEGCGCRAAGSAPFAPGVPLFALLALALLVRSRRSR